MSLNIFLLHFCNVHVVHSLLHYRYIVDLNIYRTLLCGLAFDVAAKPSRNIYLLGRSNGTIHQIIFISIHSDGSADRGDFLPVNVTKLT